MLDNDLIRLFLPIISNGLAAYGYEGVVTKQSNQPTQQGVNVGPTVYFYKVGDHRYGWLRRASQWDPIAGTMTHTEMQMYETKFSLSALVTANPKITNTFTASDLVNSCAAILQSDMTLEIFAAANVGILRIEEISNPYFTDDRDQFEAAPAFDFTLTHRQTRVTVDPVISSFTTNIKRV